MISKIAARVPNGGLIAFFVVMTLFFCFFARNFATATNVENILVGYSFIAIVALGQMFPIMARGIDLSIGSILALAGMVVFDAILIFELPGWIAIILAIAAATLAGTLNGLFIVILSLQPFVATLATLAGYRGLVYAISGRQLYPELATTPLRDPSLAWFNEYYDVGAWFGLDAFITTPWIPASFLVLLVVMVFLYVLLAKTPYGTALKATGGNKEAARLAGLRVRMIEVSAYAMSGFLAGIAAVLLVARLTTSTEALGIGMELTAIAAAVIGGTRLLGGQGNVLGPVLGAFFLGVVLIGLTLMGISQFVQQMLTGAILLAAVGYDAIRRGAGQ
ncbi:ribose transport system permease protein [Aliiroseovarius halocynthiae]|nr:ABC transporter permease [Aliiroseovarius halocynthiae]SMR83613.1 ribose transport system permease protein [Aliiroseovarius halocynthiae]